MIDLAHIPLWVPCGGLLLIRAGDCVIEWRRQR